MAMRTASTGQFSVRALFLAAGLVVGVPVYALAQGAPVPETHTVKKGDTLWDLAKTYFGDPFTWPQIYKLNTSVVEDPHWIYPGEVLRLTGAGQAVPAQPEAPVAVAPTAPAAEAAPAPAPEQAAAPAPAPDSEQAPVAEAPAPAQEPTPGPGHRPAGPLPGNPTALFGTPGAETSSETSLATYAEKAYRPLRPGEFYTAGFLTENQQLAYGAVLGNVEPPQVANMGSPTTAMEFNRIGITPPKGGAYQVGDSLLIAERITSFSGYGDVIWPTGIARVTEVSPKQTTAQVINQFKRIRIGQVALPLERFTPGGTARAVPISDGIEAVVIQARSPNVLTEQQTVLFLDKGRADGVAPGDVFEVWRTPETRWDAASTVAEPMARLQIVRVGEHTASALVVNVYASDIKPGTRAVQVAKLPS